MKQVQNHAIFILLQKLKIFSLQVSKYLVIWLRQVSISCSRVQQQADYSNHFNRFQCNYELKIVHKKKSNYVHNTCHFIFWGLVLAFHGVIASFQAWCAVVNYQNSTDLFLPLASSIDRFLLAMLRAALDILKKILISLAYGLKFKLLKWVLRSEN